MSTMSISILNPNGRRKTVKVKPTEVILNTLEEHCRIESLDSTLHEFIFQQKILNSTQTWRLANVPNNARLELEKQASQRIVKPVKIALQMQGVKRMQNVFPPSTSLRDILNHFEDQYATAIQPEVAIGILYLRKEFFGLALNETLQSLGLTSGSALLKTITKSKPDVDVLDEKYKEQLNSKLKENKKVKKEKEITPIILTAESSGVPITNRMKKEQPIPRQSKPAESMFFHNQVHETLNNYAAVGKRIEQSDSNETVRKKFKPSPSPSPPEPEMAMSFENFKFPSETEGMNLQQKNEILHREIDALSQPCDRDAVFYDETKRIISDQNIEELGDEFYEVTIDDLKFMLSELKHIQQDFENKPLKTTQTKEMERLKSMQQYPNIMIRIVFPGQLVLQGIFRPGEKTQTLYDFVANVIDKNFKNEFYLYTSPPKLILQDRKKMLFDYKLSPASKVYFGVKDGEFSTKFLTKETLENTLTPAEANQKLGTIYTNYNKENEYKTNIKKNQTPAQSEYEGGPSTSAQNETRPRTSNSNTKAPKWFKLGKR